MLASIAGAVAAVGCDRAGDVPRADSVASVPSSVAPVDSPGRPVSTGWDPAAGPVLLVAAGRPDAAIVVFPEVQGEHVPPSCSSIRRQSAARPRRSSTARRHRHRHARRAHDARARGGMVGWPMLRVTSPSGTVARAVGLIGARVVPVPLDSVASLSSADSAALVAEVARARLYAPRP